MLTQKEIGNRVKEYRESASLSQQAFVEKLNEMDIAISRETLSKIENGNRSLAVHEVKGICLALNIGVEELLHEEEEEVTLEKLFRKQNVSLETCAKVEMIEDMIINFITQKDLPTEKRVRKTPLWRE